MSSATLKGTRGGGVIRVTEVEMVGTAPRAVRSGAFGK